jgi:transposase
MVWDLVEDRRFQQRPTESPIRPPKNDLSKSLIPFEQHETVLAVVELSLRTWLVGGMVPGVHRDPLKKLAADENTLLRLVHRWRDEAVKASHRITRIIVTYEAGRDGFWLARWLSRHGIEVHVIHPTSVAVSREHRRAKSDRLDIGLLKRSSLGWLRGEEEHCTMVAIPTLEEEDAKRPTASANIWSAGAPASPTG